MVDQRQIEYSQCLYVCRNTIETYHTPLQGSFWIDTIETLSIRTISDQFNYLCMLVSTLLINLRSKAINMHSKGNRLWGDTKRRSSLHSLFYSYIQVLAHFELDRASGLLECFIFNIVCGNRWSTAHCFDTCSVSCF